MSCPRYLPGVSSLRLDRDACSGCGTCAVVCPHGVFEVSRGKAAIKDADACIECGGCARNCPENALAVVPGVGCASYILMSWIVGPDKASCNCC